MLNFVIWIWLQRAHNFWPQRGLTSFTISWCTVSDGDAEFCAVQPWCSAINLEQLDRRVVSLTTSAPPLCQSHPVQPRGWRVAQVVPRSVALCCSWSLVWSCCLRGIMRGYIEQSRSVEVSSSPWLAPNFPTNGSTWLPTTHTTHQPPLSAEVHSNYNSYYKKPAQSSLNPRNCLWFLS